MIGSWIVLCQKRIRMDAASDLTSYRPLKGRIRGIPQG